MNTDVQSLRRRVQELEEIHRLAQSLSSIVSVYETLEAVVACCLKLCDAEKGAIILLSPMGSESDQTLVRGSSTSEWGIDHRLNTLEGGLDFTPPQAPAD